MSAAPAPGLVGIGAEGEAELLSELVAVGKLRGAIVTVGETGSGRGPVPPSKAVRGVAQFDHQTKVEGEFTVFSSGSPAVASSLGAHAVQDDKVLVLGFNPDRDWGRLDCFWAAEAAAAYLRSVGRQRLSALPAVGVLRLDDTPGTALHQVQGREKGDRRQAPRIRRTARRLRAAGAILNVAVCAEALDGDQRVPLEQVWPRSVAALGDGVEAGAFEPVCHGLLHLDTEALARGEVEFREFARLDADEAGDRIDRALTWQTRFLARPTTFVAPAWSYGPASEREAAKRGLVRWHRARPGPVLDDGRLYETLTGELPGIHGLDFSPLQRLAAVGIPPMIAMHGGLLDGRMAKLSPLRNPALLARLLSRRDVTRMIGLDGIRWIGVRELVSILRTHAGARQPAE